MSETASKMKVVLESEGVTFEQLFHHLGLLIRCVNACQSSSKFIMFFLNETGSSLVVLSIGLLK